MIALVDCNNFFASCERLFRPDLEGVPVLVLSSNDGCVVARSNEVKALGIPMGVPYFKVRAIIKAHNVVYFSSNFSLYSNISQRILGTLSLHAPNIEAYSIDEAFMDLSVLKIADYKTWGDSLREEVKKTIGMPVSIGIAPTKTLAKLASGYAKKHQQTCVIDPENDTTAYHKVLAETPVSDIWGVGRRLAPQLTRAGVHTALDLMKVNERWIHSQFGINGVNMLQELRGVVVYSFADVKVPQKTLMVSRSFGHTVKGLHELETAVASFASQAAYKLRQHELTTAVFGVYLRFKTPDGLTKGAALQTRFATSTNDTVELVHEALALVYTLFDPELRYKKAGVFAGHLQSSRVSQVNLFDNLSLAKRARADHLMDAVDSINERFGGDTIHSASIDPRSKRWIAKKQRMSPLYTTSWSELPTLHKAR